MGQDDFEEVVCAICRSTEHVKYSDRGQFGLPTHVVICKKCGFSYLNPRWKQEKYDFFYTHEYDQYYRSEVISARYDYDQYKPIRSIIERLKRNHVFPNASKILDIGSGMGDGLIYLKKNESLEADFFAIEPSEVARVHLQKEGIQVLTSDVNSSWHTPLQNTFDFVMMRHVLEHFLDPVAVLNKVHHVLKPDGIVYIAVPNAKKPTKRLESFYFRAVHVSYFSTQSLKNIFIRTGLKDVLMQEGDADDAYEVFAVCKKGLKNDKTEIMLTEQECLVQEKIYNQAKRFDFYYDMKHRVIKNIKKIYA